MSTQFALNKELLEAAENGDIKKVESLLKQGADPLGSSNEYAPNEHILGELFCIAVHDPDMGERLPQLVELFLAYGMDIGSRNIPDDGNNINPLWDLAFCGNECSLKTLHVLLEKGLDHKSAESLVSHVLLDMEMCDGCEFQDDWWFHRTVCALKMVMLVASYPCIIEKSSYIGACIEIEKNHKENLCGFRAWNDFEYHMDASTCTNIPFGLLNATLTICDKQTNEPVWTFMI